MFRQTVATGEDAWTPSSGLVPSPNENDTQSEDSEDSDKEPKDTNKKKKRENASNGNTNKKVKKVGGAQNCHIRLIDSVRLWSVGAPPR